MAHSVCDQLACCIIVHSFYWQSLTVTKISAHPAHKRLQPGAKVILGMSGGVDSSVAAHLLIEQGYQVEGLFMKNWEEDDGTEYCTAQVDLEDAQAAADRFNIPLHQANFAAEYWDKVFAQFLEEYQRDRTPNPDILCNREIKFEQFVAYATTLGADLIATGHYVRRTGQGDSLRILKGIDDNKDQTYFLQAVPRQQLDLCLFPLGDFVKADIRRLASELELTNHRKKDSTGICFIGERRFADFLKRYITDQPGPITDTRGIAVGEHSGLHFYTLGQRQGINIGGLAGRPEAPWYVVKKVSTSNTLIVSQDECDLMHTTLIASQPNWLQPVNLPLTCAAKIRYRQKEQACDVSIASDGLLQVEFHTAQRAITPGQYIAFYHGEEMLGGAYIEGIEGKEGKEGIEGIEGIEGSASSSADASDRTPRARSD